METCMLTLRSSSVPSGAFPAIQSVEFGILEHHSWTCRYDAHPMSMLTSAFAMLGSFYSEANPSLQGSSQLCSNTQTSVVLLRLAVQCCRPKAVHERG